MQTDHIHTMPWTCIPCTRSTIKKSKKQHKMQNIPEFRKTHPRIHRKSWFAAPLQMVDIVRVGITAEMVLRVMSKQNLCLIAVHTAPVSLYPQHTPNYYDHLKDPHKPQDKVLFQMFFSFIFIF